MLWCLLILCDINGLVLNFQTVNDTQLHSISDKHPVSVLCYSLMDYGILWKFHSNNILFLRIFFKQCQCEVVFVQNLNKSIGLISSTSHQDHLYNIMDLLDSRPSPNTVSPVILQYYIFAQHIQFSSDLDYLLAY